MSPAPPQGAYRGIRTDISHYQLDDAPERPYERTMELAQTPTRLKRLNETLQKRLINWGYAVCDAALRKPVQRLVNKPPGFPYPEGGV
jgi:NTE family protein